MTKTVLDLRDEWTDRALYEGGSAVLRAAYAEAWAEVRDHAVANDRARVALAAWKAEARERLAREAAGLSEAQLRRQLR